MPFRYRLLHGVIFLFVAAVQSTVTITVSGDMSIYVPTGLPIESTRDFFSVQESRSTSRITVSILSEPNASPTALTSTTTAREAPPPSPALPSLTSVTSVPFPAPDSPPSEATSITLTSSASAATGPPSLESSTNLISALMTPIIETHLPPSAPPPPPTSAPPPPPPPPTKTGRFDFSPGVIAAVVVAILAACAIIGVAILLIHRSASSPSRSRSRSHVTSDAFLTSNSYSTSRSNATSYSTYQLPIPLNDLSYAKRGTLTPIDPTRPALAMLRDRNLDSWKYFGSTGAERGRTTPVGGLVKKRNE